MEREHSYPFLADRIEATIKWAHSEINFAEKVDKIESRIHRIAFSELTIPVEDSDSFVSSLTFGKPIEHEHNAPIQLEVSEGYDRFTDEGKFFSTRIVKWNDGPITRYFAGIFAENQPFLDAKRLAIGIVIQDGKIVDLTSSLYDDTFEHQTREIILANAEVGANYHEEEAELHNAIIDEFNRAISSLSPNY